MSVKPKPKTVLKKDTSLNLKLSTVTYNQLLNVCEALQVTRSEGVRRCIQAVYLGMKQAERRSNDGTQIIS